MELSQFQKTFPFKYTIDINQYNWTHYKNGWNVYPDIRQEAKRMGIDFDKPNNLF